MEEKSIREVLYFEDYYLKFYAEQNHVVKKKFNWTIQLIETIIAYNAIETSFQL